MNHEQMIQRLNEIMGDIEVIIEVRPSGNDCVDLAEIAQKKIYSLIVDLIDEEHKRKA